MNIMLYDDDILNLLLLFQLMKAHSVVQIVANYSVVIIKRVI